MFSRPGLPVRQRIFQSAASSRPGGPASQTSAQPGRAGVSIIAIPSAVGAAVLSSQHICGIVRYTGLFQQRQELLFERHILVVFALTADVGSDLVELRNTDAEGSIPVLPLKHE